MTTLFVLRGLPGCGKTTWARAWALRDPDHRARVSRDDLRRALFDRYGGDTTAAQEYLVTAAQWAVVRELAREGVDVVVDDTNLRTEHLNRWRVGAAILGAEFELIDFTGVIDVEECIRRDALREGDARVGEDVIRRMWATYQEEHDITPARDPAGQPTGEHP